METATTNLITAVDAQRTQRRMSDRKFSKQVLGISPSYWCMLKAGKRTPTLSLLLRFTQIPDIAPAITEFWSLVAQQDNTHPPGPEKETSPATFPKTPKKHPHKIMGT